MFKKLSSLKKLIWTAAAAICLIALFVGFLFAAIAPFGGTKSRPVVVLGADSAVVEKKAKADKRDKGGENGGAEGGEADSVKLGSIKVLGETADAGQDYIDSLTFLTDSCLIGMRDYGILTGGSENRQVLGSVSGSLMVNSLSTAFVVNPSDKSELTVSQAVMVSKPKQLFIMVGSDGLNSSSEEQFKASYKALISAIQSASDKTQIVCCSVLPVISGYSGIDGLNAVICADACEWIKELCGELDLYYADIRQAVKDSSGNLSAQYAGSNGKTINTQGIEQILQYLRTHALS